MGHRPCYSMSEEGRGRSVLTNSFETSWKICNLCNLLPRKVCSEKKTEHIGNYANYGAIRGKN